MSNILIMGAGGFGTALAVMISRFCSADVTVWSPFEEEAAQLRDTRANERLLPGIAIPGDIAITTEIAAAPTPDLVILATPSFAVRETARRLAGVLPREVPVACVSKGLEGETGKTLSEVIAEELPANACVAISGPSHAEELARGIPTTIVAASRSRAAAETVQDLLMNETLRIYVNDDITGVELGGALKNIIALAAGVLDGLAIGGDNTKAALMTRGITEIARLGIALGAKTETFAGLSGIGDLIVTCSSMHSRNRRFGMLIGQGKSVGDALAEVGKTVEGYPCTKTAHFLAEKLRIEMPIVDVTYQVLYGSLSPLEGVKSLMERPKRHESETIWLLSR
ncbi:NAD(P)-dependent glycerol-3-phosphate dehydrogenase [Ruminococcaceae bacterium OttesenSCG-928-L11]|nr:NAD(P)-dependent glycerol-3-phosphate dehydrogenase [Ruminococcaceae bacterium OttesenSCG-928-L11]